MFRLLRKKYLLRFKGADIFAHTLFIAILFTLISAIGFSRDFDAGLLQAIAYFSLFGLTVAMLCFLPLRMLYRMIQRLPLYGAILVTLSLTGVIAFFTVLFLFTLYHNLPYLPTLPVWPPSHPVRSALQVAVMAILGFSLVIQLAVAARRERMARRKNLSNRMKALQARIRPHFFFNTLNSVASLIRSDPEAAEKAIEDLADVFRVVIKSDRKMVSMAEEIEIAKRYMNIEKLRLGERLTVKWHASEDAMNASIPSLTLQPLLENAVYHGIEPNLEGGTVTIDCSCEEDRLLILVTNPVSELNSRHESGNKIALKNIKERLRRQFSGDVRISVRNTLARFNVSIDAPLVQVRSSR